MSDTPQFQPHPPHLDEGRFLNYLKLRDEVAAAADKLASRLADKANAKVQNKALNKRLTDKYGKR